MEQQLFLLFEETKFFESAHVSLQPTTVYSIPHHKLHCTQKDKNILKFGQTHISNLFYLLVFETLFLILIIKNTVFLALLAFTNATFLK